MDLREHDGDQVATVFASVEGGGGRLPNYVPGWTFPAYSKYLADSPLRDWRDCGQVAAAVDQPD